MEIKLIIDDEKDAAELLQRLKTKECIIWPTSIFTEKQANMMVDVRKKEIRILKATVISLPIRL